MDPSKSRASGSTLGRARRPLPQFNLGRASRFSFADHWRATRGLSGPESAEKFYRLPPAWQRSAWRNLALETEQGRAEAGPARDELEAA
jgi:hypothetical protein